MDDREWAAKWVGWEIVDWPEAMAFGLYYEVPETEFADVNPVFRTDADLAEAVRQWCIGHSTLLDFPESGLITSEDDLAWTLYAGGPLSFIAAVRELVNS